MFIVHFCSLLRLAFENEVSNPLANHHICSTDRLTSHQILKKTLAIMSFRPTAFAATPAVGFR
jgi:hypothetical protein